MKKILLTIPLLCLTGLFLSAAEPMILLKNGEQVAKSRICEHDQFGIMIETGTDPETKKMLRRFIPFTNLNPASLQFFPYCDAKVVERTNTAVSDRAELIMKKFKDVFPDLKKTEDMTKLLSIHTGVSSYHVFFIALSTEKNGTAGYLFSDSADSQFYGIIFLYGLICEKNQCWTGEIFPEDRTITVDNHIYPVFTVIPPPKPKFDMKHGMMPPPGTNPGMRPPAGAKPGMRPPAGGAGAVRNAPSGRR